VFCGYVFDSSVIREENCQSRLTGLKVGITGPSKQIGNCSKMLGRISRWRSELVRGRLERRALKALALHSCGEARPDGLSLGHLGCYLKIDWVARHIHPWCRPAELPLQKAAQMFAEQCLEDADSALARLFRNIPEAGKIEFRVLHPDTGSVIIAGAVTVARLAR
jgi:hypothetical protein